MAQKPLTGAELQELLTSPKKFLSRSENVEKVLGGGLANRRALKDQIARKVGVSPEDLALKMSGGGTQEYYAVTAAVHFLSRPGERRKAAQKAARKRTASKRGSR